MTPDDRYKDQCHYCREFFPPEKMTVVEEGMWVHYVCEGCARKRKKSYVQIGGRE